ncbi:MAG: Multicopper oxidase [Gammaproteobacteria bacterium]|nr:Multicopper oxidase [Gammaproteobacteria bacterium]
MFADVRRVLLVAAVLLFLPAAAFSQTAGGSQSGGPCPRPAAGSVVSPPPELFSVNGVLNLQLNYLTTVDSAGRTLFCLNTPNGLQGPTLHVMPGDTLNVTVTNLVPAPPPGSPTEVVSNPSNTCGDMTMTITSLNVHYHGTNTAPTCHSDEVIHTIINSGESFQYSVHFPTDEPPGLYWYHPHVHGIAEAAVQGGASGVIIVGGIANIQPAVAGLPERVLVFRDQNVAGSPAPGGVIPAWDLSLNYVPIPYVSTPQPGFIPSIIKIKQGQKEFWRVANSSADTILDLQVVYDGVAQPLSIVGFDGVPVESQDGTQPGKLLTQTDVLIPPAGRAEFIVTGPSAAVQNATLKTLRIDTGPAGDNDPERTVAVLQKTTAAPSLPMTESATGPFTGTRFAGLAAATPTAKRKLYFSEVISDPTNPLSPTNFFITVDGATPTLFDANNPPAITTTQGSVEDWVIENRTPEHHEFHMHQIHFLLLELNGVPVTPDQRQLFDMYQVPFWSGTGPYPSIKVRMDFRGPDIGDFVYHCHILGHEDNGMMAIIRVLPHP